MYNPNINDIWAKTFWALLEAIPDGLSVEEGLLESTGADSTSKALSQWMLELGRKG